MAGHLYGVHDYANEWADLVKSAAKTGWCVETVEVGDNPNDMSGMDFRHIEERGITVICRINYSHHGQGTIPLPARYNEFAARCRNFVAASKGCHFWIIGNEPNLAGERPGAAISPSDYSRCYQLCRAAIKQVDRTATIIVAAIAPYNVDTGWCIDYWRELLSWLESSGGADAFAIHCYSRGNSPQSVSSEDKMQSPYNAYYNGFRAYRDFLGHVPESMWHLPVFITETDQIEPWVDINNGWVRAAFYEINTWNQDPDHQKIQALCLYRWLTYDQWEFSTKRGVVDDLYQTMRETNYLAPVPNVSTKLVLPQIKSGMSGPSITPKFQDGLNVRVGPGTEYGKMGVVAYGDYVPILGTNQPRSWWQVQIPAGKGWVSGEVSIVSEGDKVGVVSSPAPAVQPAPSSDKNWMIKAWCRILGIDPLLAQAILTIEAAGRSFENGRMIIRLENHIFIQKIKELAPQLEGKARDHFVYGIPSYTQHGWRPTLSSPWDSQHDGGQAEEWQTFEFAKTIHERAALEAISMGMAQVMGFNYLTVGYSSPKQMFDDFNDPTFGERNQLTGFFAYIFNREGLLEAVKRKDWNTIAAGYNGLGGVATYAPLIRSKYLELGGHE